MVAKNQRTLQSGREYDAIIGKSFRKDIILKQDGADIEDSMALIQKTVYSTYKDLQELAKKLEVKGNIEATCRNNWNFVYNHIQYREDEEGKEQIRTARRTWADRFGDCDDMSVFHSSLLMCQGIAHKLRIAKYKQQDGSTPYWQHIYVIVPTGNGKYITVDTVKDKFNDEHPFTNVDENGNKIQGTKDYSMQLMALSGFSGINAEANQTQNQNYIPQLAGLGQLGEAGDIDYNALISGGMALVGNLFGGGGSSQPQAPIYIPAPAAASNSGADLQMIMQMQSQQATTAAALQDRKDAARREEEARLQREKDVRAEAQRLQDKEDAALAKTESADASKKTMMYVGAGVGGLLILGVGAYFLMKK